MATGRVEIPASAIVYPTPAIDPDPPDHAFVVARGGADWYLVGYPSE